MATASAGPAAKGASQAPARSARPCVMPSSRSAGQGRAEVDNAMSPAPALKRKERT
jgi:hypothetical protein